MSENTSRASLIYATIAGMCIFLIALGLNRFTYTPIIPFVIAHQWATLPQAGYVASANFLGYFVAMLVTPKLARCYGYAWIIIAALMLSCVGAFLCVFNRGYLWLALMRFFIGVGAGGLMILGPSVVLYKTPPHLKATISGWMFSGIGIGIVLGSLLVPLFYHVDGMRFIWVGVFLLTLLMALIALPRCWQHPRTLSQTTTQTFKLTGAVHRAFIFGFFGYLFFGVGTTPSMLFLSAYAHHILGASLKISSEVFSLFGVGSIVGAIISGWLHKKLGQYNANIIISLIGIASLLVILTLHTVAAVALSAFLVGVYTVSLVVVMSLFIADLVGMQSHAKYWAALTIAFAAAQFVSGYGYSYLLSLHVTYLVIFAIALVFLLLSLISYVFCRSAI